MTLAIELSNISKSFPGVKANDKINLKIREGTIHAIVGENGAGKSTLMKILYGMLKQDLGSIKIFDKEVNFASPKDAISKGIGMVHQHFMLADNLSVLESIILGMDRASLKVLNKSKYSDEINQITEKVLIATPVFILFFAIIHSPIPSTKNDIVTLQVREKSRHKKILK